MSNTVDTINPATEQVINSYTLLSQAQAEQVIEKSHETYLTWRLTSFTERAQYLNKLASLFESQKEALAKLMTEEMGKVYEQGFQEVQLCADICRYTAEHGADMLSDEERDMQGGRAIISYRPIGVLLGIQPWNFPLYQVIRYSAANIMAGNTTVLKHAGNVFGMAEKIETLFLQAGFPEHCFSNLLVDGKTASALISHSAISGVTFTGSDGTGKKVAEQAAKHVKKTVLELGSNDAFVVLDDADLALAVKACLQGRIINNGQTCVAAKRFVVVDSLYNDFKEALSQQFKAIKMGNPMDEDTELGPMAREDLRDKIHQQVQDSVNAGAKVIVGGEIPQQTGYYYPPTVLENLTPGMPAYDDELFGPVASLMKAKDNDDAMRIANDSRYGLGGGIFSKDEKKAIELAKKYFDTGMININGYGLAQPNLPFGGVKDSGYGREHGGFGIREFVNVKSIMIHS
ncbi:MAG TPA: NAD-dependent succinate-semialdehyde dehydrogenase [Pseudoalteromonas sp.]|jgi:succinate-semialdehyde dehydrogenase/glutarate-semialdehyde dehydrogenase|uniref:NAD-dependent succinate-semialdehyde dehydrogenase n=1 Tax=Pseudoalteromonas sp. BSi20439 TaxID=420915 RepID=UPI0002317313|nr:NAD-dependent succinate-semialdehyde dehydrogenase [Pseudoalteromonas sp. BSi20439]GAA72164.1 succinate-semialdehyde dehydrogenase [NADP+] [Pseudoalteromonas sp. BSi20439]HCP98952.1 NAD-dependent succinate-semialdehyde dehydrogenase [Pseudoalteromonas sp.]|tara:strand:+ start:357 stop:1733 length:1377 start_codon:yes stop_codon:yes gene_type:complete